ncbi:unnamed protein product [Prorocentrum cordatum]|uniref:CCHC-type domain-containing protein n=1 Tax=Prorocentrum cordatum TaxID=2364126 RepID=A0ABN9TM69_9DINO|nr:unnamed protein product [Polarella glacialis]
MECFYVSAVAGQAPSPGGPSSAALALETGPAPGLAPGAGSAGSGHGPLPGVVHKSWAAEPTAASVEHAAGGRGKLSRAGAPPGGDAPALRMPDGITGHAAAAVAAAARRTPPRASATAPALLAASSGGGGGRDDVSLLGVQGRGGGAGASARGAAKAVASAPLQRRALRVVVQVSGDVSLRRLCDAALEYKSWRRWIGAKLAVETSRGLAKEALGPLVLTLLDDEAERACEHLELADIEKEGGADLIFQALEERFPDKEASDRIGDGLESVFGLAIERGETSSACTGRARTIFAKARMEGVELPSVAQGFLLLKGARLGIERRAVVLAASQRQWGFSEMSAAIRTAYPKQMPTSQVHEVNAWEDRSATAPTASAAEATSTIEEDDVEAEINELLGEEDPIDEEDAIDILATWKETRTAMTKEKLQRGLPGRDAVGLKRLKDKVRCFLCKEIGHFSRECPKRHRSQQGGQKRFMQRSFNQGQRAVRQEAAVQVMVTQPTMAHEDDECAWSEIDVLIASWSRDKQPNLITKLTNEERFRRLAHERRETEQDADADEIDEADGDEDTVEACACHAPGCGALDSGCGMALIGSETLEEYEKETGLKPEWEEDVPSVRFKSYDGKLRRCQEACWIQWHIPAAKKRVKILVYVIEGKAGLLISKQVMKMLQANLDMSKNRLWLGRLDTSASEDISVQVLAVKNQVPGVMEIFSPPRVCPHAPDYGVRDLGSFDKVSGWGARQPQDVQELWDRPNGPIFVKAPREHTPKGHHPDQLYELVNGYGGVDQPQRWFSTFKRYAEEIGFVVSSSDRLPTPTPSVACAVVGQMVGFTARGEAHAARSFLQSLTDAETSYPNIVGCVAADRKMTVKVPAGVLDTGLKASRHMRVTLTYHNNTNYVQVLTGAAIEDSMIRQVMRFPPYEDEGKGTEAGSSIKKEEPREDAGFIKVEMPDLLKEGPAYQEALSTTVLAVIERMSNYPDQRGALLRVMKTSFGLEMTALEAERQDSYDREQKAYARRARPTTSG